MNNHTKDYISKRGVVCPFCNSTEIEAGDSNFEADYVTQAVSCNTCTNEWTDIYKLVDAEGIPEYGKEAVADG